MAALPKFSFSGWNSSSLAPKVNPSTLPGAVGTATGMQSQAPSAGGAGMGVNAKVTPNMLKAWAAAAAAPGQAPDRTVSTDPVTGAVRTQVDTGGSPGQLVGTTNVANTNLPAWLQTEVDRLNAQDALRTAALGGGGGGGGGGAPSAPAFDPNIGVAAVTNARANYNAQINQMNEAARLQLLIQQRNQLRPVGGFGFNNPLDVPRQIGLDREIDAYRNVNLPVSAGIRPSGWASPAWAQPTWR